MVGKQGIRARRIIRQVVRVVLAGRVAPQVRSLRAQAARVARADQQDRVVAGVLRGYREQADHQAAVALEQRGRNNVKPTRRCWLMGTRQGCIRAMVFCTENSPLNATAKYQGQKPVRPENLIRVNKTLIVMQHRTDIAALCQILELIIVIVIMVVRTIRNALTVHFVSVATLLALVYHRIALAIKNAAITFVPSLNPPTTRRAIALFLRAKPHKTPAQQQPIAQI